MATPATNYDQVRYPGKFYPQASPERLATLAILYGLRPAPVAKCRVLELGCGEGGNVIPLASVFPESEFHGIDLSQSAIEYGQGLIARLGLKNAHIAAQDMMEFPADAGEFDYIVAHGILSWVPEQVREQMLEICSRHLAPKGVAYLSYNTLPGGYLRSYPRDLMRFHTRHMSDPETKLREARSIVDMVVAAIPTPTIERELLKREMQPYEGRDFFLYHDLLAEVNDPVYFLDFMDAASRCGLQFVAEATNNFSRMTRLPEAVRKYLESIGDRRMREQYLDFIEGRRFRQTVLCRSGHDLDFELTPERVEPLLLLATTRPTVAIEDWTSHAPVEFKTAQGVPVTCTEPFTKAFYQVLGEHFPHGLRYSELREEIVSRTGAVDDSKLMRVLVASFSGGVVDVRSHKFTFAEQVSERPVASALARVQAELGNSVASLNLGTHNLPDGLVRTLVPLLDGTRDLQGLVLELSARGVPNVSEENVRKALEVVAGFGLLVI